MSETNKPGRFELMRQLGEEIRAGQRATDVLDDLVAELMGVNRTDARCLDILEQQGRMTAGKLASESELTTGAVTAVIDRLERAGYARRVADETDRRRVLVELTPLAHEQILELMGRPMREAAVPMMDRYSDSELELLIEFQRSGREIQERHAEWLRDRLEKQQRGRPADRERPRGPRRLRGFG